MIKAIVFDCFGVLVTEAWLPFKAKHFGHDSELYEKASEHSNQANTGLIGYKEFFANISKMAGVTPSHVEQEISRNIPDEELLKYLDELKKDYKLGFLSNIAGDRLHSLFTADQLALFDVIELSYKTGFVKPQAGAYQGVADKLGIDVAETVFIDDQERNITGAKDAGMQAILYKNLGQLKADLAPLLSA